MTLEIIPFEPRYARLFKSLNQKWIEKFFVVEPMDIALLDDCQQSIIDIGGFIFFAKYQKAIVGCFALIPHENGCELGKMAVDDRFQGLKIGQELLSFAIAFAKKQGWEKIILYSSRKLHSALHIYKKYGFNEVAIEKNSVYARSDIKMELELY
ncbi:GNAT family N-acetyltransferase [Pareuzebyella sediminis]|uniref:GNAT family N-acetyltransferase n=1 Tax=Pareuzebyella sediminis TaxID=2607998 RepID=UPI0011EE1E01|nr:GNAT family N-acetyltransferase [Pareuzebyella sediminis]